VSTSTHLLGAARRLHSRGQNETAIEVCLSALDRGETGAALLTVLAACYYDLGRTDDALAAAYASCVVEPPTAGRVTDLGVLCEDAGLLVEAQRSYQRALELDPHHPRAARLLRAVRQRIVAADSATLLEQSSAASAASQLRKGDPEAAAATADRLEEAVPHSGVVDLIRAAVAESAGRYKEAAESYAAAERSVGQAADARARAREKQTRARNRQALPVLSRVQCLLESGDEEGAARAATALIGLAPDSPAPYLLWARLAAQRGLAANAVQNLREALKRAGRGRDAIALRIAQLNGRLEAIPTEAAS